MKITVRTLQQNQFSLEVDPQETVRGLKQRIATQEGHQIEWQKLIHSGKILEDTDTVGSYNIQENEFVVLLVRKPKEGSVVPTPTQPQSQPQQTSTPQSTTPIASTTPSTPAEKPKETPTTSAPKPETPSNAQSNLVMGSEYERSVQQLVDMGFDKEQVTSAMRAAFNNPDRAVEYLMNGIPDFPEAMAPPPQQPRTPTSPIPSSTGTGRTPTNPMPSTGGIGLSPSTPLIPPNLLPQQQQPSSQRQPNPFDFLRAHPQFNTLRQMVQSNPQLLQPVLQQLGQQNPNLLQLISQHQQEFINLLNEPVTGGGGPQPQQGGGNAPPGSHYIQVTPEEKAAIDRLESLGFDRSQAIEAFFACDKDETLAANYLLEGLGEDFEDDAQT